MSELWQCWECGKDAPGGVCVGPHPAFQWNRARSRGRVLTMYAIDANGEPLPRDIAQAWRKNHGYQLVRIDAGKHRSGPSSYITLKLMWPLGGRFVDHTAGVPA